GQCRKQTACRIRDETNRGGNSRVPEDSSRMPPNGPDKKRCDAAPEWGGHRGLRALREGRSSPWRHALLATGSTARDDGPAMTVARPWAILESGAISYTLLGCIWQSIGN